MLVLRAGLGDVVSDGTGDSVRERFEALELDRFRKKDPSDDKPEPNDGILGRPRNEAGLFEDSSTDLIEGSRQ